jgi:copper transport protein
MIAPVALSGAALLVVSGVTTTLLQLGEWHELWSTTWGRYVALKVLLMLAIAALGARNWRQFGPRLAQAGVDRRLRRTLGAELGLAALVVLITALLVVTPLPGE